MPRPRASETQRLHAYGLFLRRFGPTAIHEELTNKFEESEDVVSLRTVKNWTREFRGRNIELDGPFEWHRIEAYQRLGYNIPWQSSAYILEKWAYFQEELLGYQEPSPLSIRQVKWWLRVHLAAPDIGTEDTFWLAQRFVMREQLHDVLGLEIKMDDLEGHLAYAPWRDDWSRMRYLRAVEEGRIRAVPDVERLDQLAQLKRTALADTRPVGMAMAAVGFPGLFPELLPSQKVHIAEHLLTGGSEPEALTSAFEHYRREDNRYRRRRIGPQAG